MKAHTKKMENRGCDIFQKLASSSLSRECYGYLSLLLDILSTVPHTFGLWYPRQEKSS